MKCAVYLYVKRSAQLSSILFMLLFSFLAHSSALLMLNGKLISMDKTSIVIETVANSYTVNRQYILKSQNEQFKRTEVPVSVSIPPEAIVRVTPRKAKI